jgi:hypothetical protein
MAQNWPNPKEKIGQKPFYRGVREVRRDFFCILRVLSVLGGEKLDFENAMGTSEITLTNSIRRAPTANIEMDTRPEDVLAEIHRLQEIERSKG